MAGTSKQTDSSCFPSSSSFEFWDVFLSFGVKDTRKGFIGNLYFALEQAGIRTFKDEPGLERGEGIAAQLIKAIHDSKMSIVVFSKNYASSKWCLNELAEILGCERTRGQIVLPVFYDVDPLNVRYQTESYAEAFEKHEILYAEKVETWKAALTKAANISGYDLKNDANGHEADLIQKIVNDVLIKLCPKYLNVTEHQVGIDSRVKEISQKLSIGSNEIRFVGIYGMAGIGKTTIAKALYNKIYKEFEVSCFLENVREACEGPHGLHYLLEQLIFQLLKIKDFKVTNVDTGISFVKQRLRSKKVLIVLDDLDEINQLESLAGNCNWFGSGSRVILTTRDSRLLVKFHVDLRYEVEELDVNESLELFRRHAFRNNTNPLKKLMELSNDIVRYVGGLPLALQVLGSSLFERTMAEWESVFGKLKEIPHKHILEKLRISYNALDDNKVRDIFLDIACFFIGMDKDDATKILDACDFFPEIGISILRERCLLKIDNSNKLSMHNLIRDIGREIVREESVKNPRKRSRLWFHKDAYDILKKFKGGENIEGIRLVMPMQEEATISTRAFHSLPYLRLLQISNVNLTGSFENLFEELRWFCWNYSSLDCLPSSFQAPKLISLDMQHSKVKKLWEGTKQLQSLKILNAGHSHLLKTTPDFRGLESLEKLILERCSSLSRIHPSIGLLHKLVHLDLSKCSSLNRLPEQLGNMGCLRRLDASDTPIEQLPDSIGHLGKLTELYLGYCENLRNLPGSICYLTSLTYLGLFFCSNLESLPENLGNMQGLMNLSVYGTKIMQLPDSIGCLTRLKELYISSGKRSWNIPIDIYNPTSPQTHLRSLSKLPPNLRCLSHQFLPELSLTLQILQLSDCISLRSLPKLPPNLRNLQLSHCLSLQFLPELPLTLETLWVDDFISLRSLPKLPPNLSHLHLSRLQFPSELPLVLQAFKQSNCISLPFVTIFTPNLGYKTLKYYSHPRPLFEAHALHSANCNSLELKQQLPFNLRNLDLTNRSSLLSLPELPLHLCVLDLSNCTSLESLPDLPPDLVELNLGNCTRLESLPELPPVLYDLCLDNCTSLKSLPKLPTALVNLDLTSCTSLESLPELPTALVNLDLSNCTSLKSLPELHISLFRLDLTSCTSLESLPELPTALGNLDLSNCTSLKSLPELHISLFRLDLSNCTSLKSLPKLPPDPREFYLNNCSNLESLTELPPDLDKLVLTNCNRLLSLQKLPPNLEDIRLINCTSLQSLPNLPCKLEYLDLTGCSNLRSLPKFHSNLGYLDLSNCSSLESLQELPHHLYSLNASGCKSLQTLPDLSNLTNLGRLILTDCSNLISTFIGSFLRDCSGLDGCNVYLPSRVIQDWFCHQRTGSSTSFLVPGEVKSNFKRMAFWVVFGGKLHSQIKAVITNKTDGTQFNYLGSVQTTGVHSWVRPIGKPIPMKSGDRIQVSFRGTKDVTVKTCGVYLDCKRARDVDAEEPLCGFKMLKHSSA